MTIGLYDTFANPQGCHIIWGSLYSVWRNTKLTQQHISLSNPKFKTARVREGRSAILAGDHRNCFKVPQ